jgi:hypothetical protein
MKRTCTSLAFLIALFALTASAAWADGNKVQVCHTPSGNPDNAHTITVSEDAVQAHLGHGDYLGACFCEQNPCQNGGVCDSTNALCICPPGFTGQFCQSLIEVPPARTAAAGSMATATFASASLCGLLE